MPPAGVDVTPPFSLSLSLLQLVGVRVPNHRFVRELVRACDGPLALTSANVSDRASSLTVTVRRALVLWELLFLSLFQGSSPFIEE